MERVTGKSLPTLPVEAAAFSENPDPFLTIARQEHPWLARFSQGYVVHGHRAAEDLLSDDANLVVGFAGVAEHYGLADTMWGRFLQGIMSGHSGAEHRRLRSSVAHAFTPRHANQVRPLVERVITGLLDEWAPRREFDFADFASYFPIAVICSLLGMSTVSIPRIRTAIEVHFAVFTLDLALKPLIMPNWDILWAFADELVLAREAIGEHDPDSLLDALIEAKNNGRMDEVELRFMLILLLEAGYDSSKNMLTLTMNTLLEHPDIYLRCANDKEYCGRVVQEALRQSGVAVTYRMVTADFVYDGQAFKKGERLAFPLSLPGRDPIAFTDPLSFDPLRSNADRHVAFGRGAHICLGQFIARMLLQEGLHQIARRLTNPRRNGEITWRPILGVWGLQTLPIVFDPT